MTNTPKLTALALTALFATAPFSGAFAGNADAGEADFKKCKACHQIADAEGVIVKGGKTGPNLYGIVGKAPGSVEGFKYGKDLVALGEAGTVWTEELLVSYVADPKKFLSEQLGKSAKSRMSFKMKDASDIVAYLASFSPAAAPEAEESAEVSEESGAPAEAETAETPASSN